MEKKGICGICPYNCAVIVKLNDDKIVDVFPDKTSSYGNLCPRGKAAKDIIYNKNRILRPLIRDGQKGEAIFREGSWEEALNIIGNKFNDIISQYGSKSIASYFGGGSLEDSLCDFYEEYFKIIGSPNDMNSGSICFVSSKIIAPVTTSGLYGGAFDPDMENSEVIFIWGKNPKTDSGTGFYKELLDAKKRGAKIVTIDPRETGTTKISDLWISINPGTDGALALAMIKKIIDINKYDKEFVLNHTYGYEDFKIYLNSLEIDYLLKCCGITEEQMNEAVDLFCSTEKVSVTFYTGLEYQPSGVQNTRLIYILWAIGGKIDVKGGQYIKNSFVDNIEEYIFDEENMPIGAKEYPLFSALTGRGQFVEYPKAVLQNDPYPIKGLLILGGSPILSYPDVEIWKKVYEKQEFMVIIDRFMTEEARWADVILPSTTYYENLSYCYDKNEIRLRERIINPVGEARNDVFILEQIGEKLGIKNKFPKDDEELLNMSFKHDDEILRALKEKKSYIKKDCVDKKYKKYATGHLRKDGNIGFPTPTGKFEIKSTLLEKYGYLAIPKYKDPMEIMNKDGKFSFLLTTGGRSPYRYNSFGSNIKELSKKEEIKVDINKIDAQRLNIKQDEKVIVETSFGMEIFKANICNNKEGVVHIPNGGGSSFQDKIWSEKNINNICGYNFRDEISGFIVCKSIPCNISKI